MYINEFGLFCCLSVYVDGLYCSLFELVPLHSEENDRISLLLQEIREKDLVRLFIMVLVDIVMLSNSVHEMSKMMTKPQDLSEPKIFILLSVKNLKYSICNDMKCRKPKCTHPISQL